MVTRGWYRLTVEGELGELAHQAFEGVPVTTEGGNTVFTVRDQAELLGLAQRISALGLTVVSAARADAPARPRP